MLIDVYTAKHSQNRVNKPTGICIPNSYTMKFHFIRLSLIKENFIERKVRNNKKNYKLRHSLAKIHYYTVLS